MFFLLLLPKHMSSNCPLHDCSFIKDSENIHWKAQGEFWSKHKFHVFVGNCLMNFLLDSFWIHFGLILAPFWDIFWVRKWIEALQKEPKRRSWPQTLKSSMQTLKSLVRTLKGIGTKEGFPKRLPKGGEKGSKRRAWTQILKSLKQILKSLEQILKSLRPRDAFEGSLRRLWCAAWRVLDQKLIQNGTKRRSEKGPKGP